MYNLYPYFTNDGSVGLFSPVDDDIYHSTYGAATEAYEKFIFPAKLENFFLEHNEIKVLDICYGIGYNSKSLINFIFQLRKILEKNHFESKTLSPNNDSIHSNNNDDTINNDSIYSDNKPHEKNINNFDNYEKFVTNIQNCKIYIKALDTDKVLAGLSPFFRNLNCKERKNCKPAFKNEKIEKYLNTKQKSPKYDYILNLFNEADLKSDIKLPISSLVNYTDEINLILLDKILKNDPDIFLNSDICHILNNKNFSQYFYAPILFWLKKYYNVGRNNTPIYSLKALLHNIYYNHLTKRYKKALNSPLYKDLTFDLKINDARKEIIKDTNKYNFIFLDAFTPSKCPCLWSVDFFKQLYNHLDDNGMILTYSSSTNIRNAFVNAGFYIGKIYNVVENKFTGTIAVKNQALIKYELSEYDLGLLKTKAGIFYRDENLMSLNEEIIKRRDLEVKKSSLMSSSRYIKATKNLK